MSNKFAFEYTNGYQPDKHTNNRNKTNLNCIYIASKSPPLYHNLNSVSSNTYSSYDTKLSSNNSKTSNVSSSNESSMLNNSYHSTHDDYIEPQFKQTPTYLSKNYADQRYSNYIAPHEATVSSKHSIKIKNLPHEKARLNESILRNKISDYKPSFNPLNKRHSVNIDSYPSTPRSNLSTPPVHDVRSSNDKLLGYEYLCNSNYDRIPKKENLENNGEGSYSMLTGSMNKDRKAKSILNVSSDYSRVAGDLEIVKPETLETVTNTESPLYKKIMSKLSEIPDSMFTKSLKNSADQVTEFASSPVYDQSLIEKTNKNKANHSAKISATLNTNKYPIDPKYVSLIDVNQQNFPTLNDNRLAKENKRSKYKSMYFDSKGIIEDQKAHVTQGVQKKEKLKSQAGDLIYTSLPFYSSSLPKKTSNPTYDINDYLYSDESSKAGNEAKKIEDKKKVGEQEKLKANANQKSKDSVGVSNKNGINAYIKLIDATQNKQKNLSSLDEFVLVGQEKHNSLSKKNSIDSSYQTDMNSAQDKLNISDSVHPLDDLNLSYQSNCSNKPNNSLFSEPNFPSVYKPIDRFKSDHQTTRIDLNKSLDTAKKMESKSQALNLNRNKDTEEIEKAAIFDQSSSFSESVSEIDCDLLDNNVELRRKRYKKRRPKNLNIILSIPDKKNIAKIISNYPVKSSFQQNKTNSVKSKQQDLTFNNEQQIKERKLSNDFDQEISELTEKMDLNVNNLNDKNRQADSIEAKYPILMRKISTPPPLPHILEARNKRNTIHGSDNIYLSMDKPPEGESKPVSITSAIRDGKTEKPIRVSHGLPPPPPILSQHNSFNSNLNETINKDAKLKDESSKLNESVFSNKNVNPKSDNNKRPQLIKNSHVVSRTVQKEAKILKKDEKPTTATNLPLLDKIDYVLKTTDDKFLTNIVPYLDDAKNHRNKREHRKTIKAFHLNEYRLDEDTWSSSANGKNFYENYARENDRRKKEGSGFLMLLPGIAIPIDTDAADSDESS